MARPKKIQPQVEESFNEENLSEAPTEREMAPEPVAPVYVPPAPRQVRVERQGDKSEPYVRRFPQIRSGICEYCGVIDPNYPSQYQYKMCPHYRNMDARCSYCPDSKDPEDVLYHSVMNVAESPNDPGVLIMWCNSYECSKAHEARFKRA